MNRPRRPRWALSLLLVGACSIPEPAPSPPLCSTCHGSADNAAPPSTLAGESTGSAVGAHQTHLRGSALGRPVACAECHLVPAAVAEPGHVDTLGPAEVVFGALARTGSRTPSWEGGACAGTYCHAGPGAAVPSPSWGATGAASCGGCHGMPPPPPHVADTACAGCHAPVAGPGQTLASPARHADGVLDVDAPEDCSGCHGSTANPAPPRSLAGATSTSSIGVGAHQAHLQGARLGRKLACTSCHAVPARVDSPGHTDSPAPAELTFAPEAGRGLTPRWDRGARTCADTYCHGGTLAGGAHATPVWTQVDGTQVSCGSCHGAPPPPPHPAGDCAGCHAPVAGPGLTIADPTRHGDGTLQVVSGCSACHGSTDNPAPPRALSGATDTSTRAVGAHQAHLAGTRLGRPVRCRECHVVPAATDDAGHLDSPLPAELAFGSFARTGGLSPTWDRAAETCGNTYCHGASLAGGAHSAPIWTQVDGTQVSCGSCHGAPPPAPHPDSSACESCHAPVAGPNRTIADPMRHADGTLDLAQGCADCHGSAANAAPPKALDGSTAESSLGVGAHQAHLAPSIGRPVPCAGCHVVPAAVGDPGHLDAALPAELTFGALAGADGAAPMWDRGAATCSGVYCHGVTRAGGDAERPVWTQVDGTFTACTACHGFPPPAPHPNNASCGNCHRSGGASEASKHIDGTVDFQ